MKIFFIIILILFLLAAAVILAGKFFSGHQPAPASDQINNINVNNMTITSSVFEDQGILPARYSCDGESINPPLEFSDAPQGTMSLVLIVDDPDAPSGDFVHWVVYNIDPAMSQLMENSVPNGAALGKTSAGRTGWVAPCPPSGEHRYQFKVYALDTLLTLGEEATKAQVLEAAQGRILGQAMITGLYRRK